MATKTYKNLSTEDVSDLTEAFKSFDRDGDGRITSEEVASIVSGLGMRMEDSEIQAMMQRADKDGSGCIDLEEFLEVHDTAIEGKSSGEELREVFKIFDLDSNGVISADELLKVLKGLGDDGVTLKDCRDMIKNVDANGDGCVDFNEFSKMMQGMKSVLC